MSRLKSILLPFCVALIVAGCGGGGDATSTAPVTDNTDTAPIVVPNPDNSGDPPDTENPPETLNEPQLSGQLTMVANQMPYIDGDRDRYPMEYNAIDLESFENTIGLYGAAWGTSDGAVGTGFPATAPAPAAPLARFGLRVSKGLAPIPGGSGSVREETIVGRIAFSFTERDDSPGTPADQREFMSFVIDQVQVTTRFNSQTGFVELESVELLDDARMHLHGRNATGAVIQTSIPVQSNAVRLEPVSNLIDDYGDTSSVILMADLEAAFSQGVEQFAALNNLAGHFSMGMTISFAQIDRPSEQGENGVTRPRRTLAGPSITVNDQPAVNGGGISGNVWIRAYPPL